MTIVPRTPIRLTPAGQARFPDIGARPGTVIRVDGWPVVRFQGLDVETRLPPEMLEVIS